MPVPEAPDPGPAAAPAPDAHDPTPIGTVLDGLEHEVRRQLDGSTEVRTDLFLPRAASGQTRILLSTRMDGGAARLRPDEGVVIG